MSSDFNEIYEKAFNAKAQRRRDAKENNIRVRALEKFFTLKFFAPLRLCVFALN
jgi:hypothetical protein